MFLCHLHICTDPTAAVLIFFFFNDTATTEIYTLSLHDALPISPTIPAAHLRDRDGNVEPLSHGHDTLASGVPQGRSEEHTSELQSQSNLVCRLLLEKKKTTPSRPRPVP